jgi:hypothetical protein
LQGNHFRRSTIGGEKPLGNELGAQMKLGANDVTMIVSFILRATRRTAKKRSVVPFVGRLCQTPADWRAV